MTARLRAWLEMLGNQFWLRPAIIVLACVALAQTAVWFDAANVLGVVNASTKPWGYSGGAEGARALLGGVASSSIGVASTIFSITIAALSLASGQMGPRLLRNFVRDGRNQVALGIFVGTFAFALIVLRTVRTEQEGAFVPHAAVTAAIALALICVATLVWFVHHVATSINVEKVLDAVHRDLIIALEKGTSADAGFSRVSLGQGFPVAVAASQYLQAVDLKALADWAAETETRVALRVRPGDYIPRGMPIADLRPARSDGAEALSRYLTFGREQVALQDLEHPVRQLVEIAVRALSPGINDPFTAGSVLERLGDALCHLSGRSLPTGAIARNGEIVLLHPVIDYQGLCDAMLHPIRQNASRSAYVLIRLLEVLTKVVQVERMGDRLSHLNRHADLAVDTGKRQLGDEAAIAELIDRRQRFEAAIKARPLGRRQDR